MTLNKKDILKALETISAPGAGMNLIESESVTNVVIFNDEVVVDVTIDNPSLQAKKKTEVEIMKVIHDQVYQKAKVQVNVKVSEMAAKPKVNLIKGQPIPGIQNIVAVASGKGGVGKSTVTANLAVSLQQKGFKVGILDADLYGPSMPTMFDCVGHKPLAATIEGKSKMVPAEVYGIKLLSLGFFTAPNQAVIWRGAMASKALNQLIFDAHWGELDFLLIDLPPGTGDIHLSIMQSLPITGAVVVSTPQEVALADARKGIAMFRQESIQVPVLGIIENMAYFTPEELPNNKYYIFGKAGARNLSEQLEVPFLGELPLIQSIREAGDVGRPAALQENEILSTAFDQLTQNMVSELVKRNEELPATEAIKITTMAGCSTSK